MSNDGGPAFPVGSGDMRDPTGMTLRDYFAGQAVAAAIAHSGSDQGAAMRAYRIADAMLKARKA